MKYLLRLNKTLLLKLFTYKKIFPVFAFIFFVARSQGEVVNTPANTSGYSSTTINDPAFSPPPASTNAATAAGATTATKTNAELTIAEKNSILNQVPCERITQASDGFYSSKTAPPIAVKAQASCVAMRTSAQSCDSLFTGTIGVNFLCHTEKNESIANSVALIQGVMGAASSIVDSCNDFGKAMNIAQKAMTLYTTACGAAQVACKMKCSGATAKTESFMAETQALLTQLAEGCKAEITAASSNPATVSQVQLMTAHCNAVLNAINLVRSTSVPQDDAAPFGIKKKAEICVVSVPQLLLNGVIGIAAFANAKAQADKCKKDAQAKDDAKKSCANPENKDRPDCIDPSRVALNCNLSENADKTQCICKANPRLKGCPGELTTNSNTDSGVNTSRATGDSRTPSGGVATDGGSAETGSGSGSDTGKNDGSGTGAVAGGLGGGGLGGAGSGSGSGSSDGKSGDEKSGLNANVLDGGGGGFGGGFRFSGSGLGANDYKSKLRDFAAKNNLGKNLAGNAWKQQVTGGNGRSNFDKVKVRYQEQSSTLINKGN